MKKVLFLVNHDIVIYNFRKELVERLLQDGYKVYISSPYGERIDDLVSMGCEYINTSIDRHGTNIIQDFKLILHYKKIIRDIKPDVVLTYTIKPNIYGGIACKSLKTPYIANITGLGTAVENGGIMQKLTTMLYKIAFKKVRCVFFQNTENQQFFIDNKIALKRHRLIPGSGVNLEYFHVLDYPDDEESINFLFIGRIMRDKGVNELFEAAKQIKEKHTNVQFILIGDFEEDYNEKILDLEKNKIIEYHGRQKDVRPFIKGSHAIILPSYHEGTSNVLLESASSGRPVIASNIAGCKETFDEGISGLGFEAKNTDELVKTLITFIELPFEYKRTMGIAGRKKMKQEYNRQIVIDTYLEEMNKIL